MALRVVTVKSAGGDYSSLNAALVGEVGDFTASGLNRQLEIDCYNFVDATTADSGAGWTTDATHTVLVTAVDNHLGNFGGIGGAAAYSRTAPISTQIAFATFRGLSVDSGVSLYAFKTDTGGTDTRFERCIAAQTQVTFGVVLFDWRTAGCYGENCLAVLNSVLTGSGGFRSVAAGTNSVNNCTSYRGDTGFLNGGGTFVATNCIADGSTSAGFSSGTWTGSANCASTDANVPTSGSGHRANQAILLNGPATGDYSLDASDAGAKGYGVDLSADPTFPFATDITGAARTVPWDIGAFLPTGTSSFGYLLEYVRLILEDGSGAYATEDATGALLNEISAISDTADRLILEDSSGILSLEVSPVTLTPSVGVLTATGQAPAVVLNTILAPQVGALTVTGFAPSIVVGTVAAPSVGSLTATGSSPSVVLNTILSPALGAVAATGFAPSVVVGTVVAPNGGTLTASGLAPAVVLGTVASPVVGSLVASGLAPSVLLETRVTPALGQLTVAGVGPSVVVGTVVTPNAGTLALSGFAPTVTASDNRILTADVGSLAITGFAPAVVVGTVLYPDVGAASVAGLAPQAVVGTVVTPNVGSVVATGLAPSLLLDTRLAADVGILTVAGFAPSVVVDTRITPDVGDLTLTGGAPSVVVGNAQVVTPDVGLLSLDGFAPTVIATDEQTLTPAAGALSIDGFAPTVSGTGSDGTLEPGTGALDLAGFAPSVVVREKIVQLPIISAIAPAFRPIACVAGIGELTLEGFAPTIVVVPATTPPAELPAIVAAPVVCMPGTGELSFDARAATVRISDNRPVAPKARQFAIEGHAPTIHVSTRQIVEDLIAATKPPFDEPPPTIAFIPSPVIRTPPAGRVALVGHAPTLAITSTERAVASSEAEADEEMVIIASFYYGLLT